MDFIYFSSPCNVQCQIGLSFSIGTCSGNYFVCQVSHWESTLFSHSGHEARDWLHVPWVGDHCMVSCRSPFVTHCAFCHISSQKCQSIPVRWHHQNLDIFAQVLYLEFNMKDQIVTGIQYYLLFFFCFLSVPTPHKNKTKNSNLVLSQEEWDAFEHKFLRLNRLQHMT